MLRRDFAKALIAAGVGVAAPSVANEPSDELLVLDNVQRLTVNPGDVVVLSVDRKISYETSERLREHVRGVFTDNKVLVLSDGLEIGVVGPDA